MDAADPSATVLNADPEHSGVRYAVMGALVITFVLVFLFLVTFLRSLEGTLISEFYFALACAGALPLAIGAAGLAEYISKRRWLSGKSVVLNDLGMVVRVQPEEAASYRWDGHISLVKWYFLLSGYRRGGRERRIPSGWTCVCCQVQQDEERFIVFSYMPQEKVGQFTEDSTFLELKLGDFQKKSMFRRWLAPPNRPDIPTKILAGKQGHYWLAERRRWSEGMELDQDDFFLFMSELNRRVVE